MTAYNIIHRHPEWVTSERTPRAAIQNEARRYVRELEGSKNFSGLITEDLDDLLRQRDAANDFAGVVADGNKAQANTDSPEYLTDRRKAQIYAIFIKAVISELSGKAVCTAAQVEEWKERYAVKLEGLKGKDEKEKKRYCNVPDCVKSIVNDQAKKIYAGLAKYGYIDCAESTFLWYFGNKSRREAKQPQKIKWITEDQKDGVKIFAFIWKCLYRFAETGDIEKETDVSWQIIDKYFDVPQAWLSKTLREEARQAINSKKRNDEISRIKEIFSDITKEVNKKAEDFNRERVRLEIQENRRRKNDPDPKERSKYIPDLDVL